MTETTNPYCETLGIDVPDLAVAKNSSEANYYALLIVALLERGAPMTLADAAVRFEAAGVASAELAFGSLKRCKPGRPPVYRDGDCYALDPHDEFAGLWAFRLGLRPPKGTSLRVVRPEPQALPAVESVLTVAHLDAAWRGGVPNNSSAQRLALCVLDAHGGTMSPDAVVAFVTQRSESSPLSVGSARYWRRDAAVHVRDDGLWEMDPAHPALASARQAVRACIEINRRQAHRETDRSVAVAHWQQYERRREAHARELARLRHALLVAFPNERPEAIVLIDTAQRDIRTYAGHELASAIDRLEGYDVIAAVDVRGLLRTFGFEPGQRRLIELGPQQKTKKLNRQGRILKITNTLLAQGSCGISSPFGDDSKLREYLKAGTWSKLQRRLEADAKSLCALYEYGRLHGFVRLRWGFLDERITVPWAHSDEINLYHLKKQASESGVSLEVVLGSTPGWAEPWSRGQPVYIDNEQHGSLSELIDSDGYIINEDEIQLARLQAGIEV